MGRRSLISKYQVLVNADSTTSPISVETDVSAVDEITYEFTLGAAVNAILEVQVCNDKTITNQSVFRPLNFSQTLSLVGATDTSGLVHIKNKGFKFMKVSVANNGGTGIVSAWVTGTTVGA